MIEDIDKRAEEIHRYVHEKRGELIRIIGPTYSKRIMSNYVVMVSSETRDILHLWKSSLNALAFHWKTGKSTPEETFMGFPLKVNPDPRSSQRVILCRKEDWQAIEKEWKV